LTFDCCGGIGAVCYPSSRMNKLGPRELYALTRPMSDRSIVY
jgi:hypothetical protein